MCSLHKGILYRNFYPVLPPSCYGVDGRLWCWQAFYGLTQTIKKHTWGLLQVLYYMNILGSITTQCWINHKVTCYRVHPQVKMILRPFLSDLLPQSSPRNCFLVLFLGGGGQSELNMLLNAKLSVQAKTSQVLCCWVESLAEVTLQYPYLCS